MNDQKGKKLVVEKVSLVMSQYLHLLLAVYLDREPKRALKSF